MTAFKHKHLHGVVKKDIGVLYPQDQNFPYGFATGHRTLVGHVLFELKVHEKLGVRLAVHEVLCYNVVRLVLEVLAGDRLDL